MKQLADMVGCRWGAISRWERGEREPRWSQVVALCSALKIDCSAFMQEPRNQAKAHLGAGPRVPSEEKKPGKGKGK
jgi:hypothetical protein